MTSLWYEALLIAEQQCVQKGHHDGSRNINVVWTRESYAPAVCEECLEYARMIKEDEEALMDKKETMTLKLDNRSKLTLINGDYVTQITFIEAARMFGSDSIMKLTQAIQLMKSDIATLEVQPKKGE